MIITRLQGGLGNQLFQFAAGYALAKQLCQPLKLDIITSFPKNHKRSFELEKFHIAYTLATPGDLRKFIPVPRLYRHLPGLLSIISRNVYREPHFQFDPNFYRLTAPVFLDGFWQSPKYFENIEGEIRRLFHVTSSLIQNVQEKGNELRSEQSVSIHIRRSDFLAPKAAAYHGVLSKDYYQRAIRHISGKIPGASFHFFSDDMEWVKRELSPPPGSQYVSGATSAIEDFYLMSCCRHNIIANSSFSWWAAWLNDNPLKIVVAPKAWFAANTIDSGDLIPRNWERL